MGRDDFTFLNETGEKITVKHQHKDITGEAFSLENGQSKKIQVDIPSETYEKYWLCNSADAHTGKYVDSDDYTSSKQVTVVKQGDEFQLNFLPRSEGFFKNWTKKLQSSLTWPKNRESGSALPITRSSSSGRN